MGGGWNPDRGTQGAVGIAAGAVFFIYLKMWIKCGYFEVNYFLFFTCFRFFGLYIFFLLELCLAIFILFQQIMDFKILFNIL